MQHRALKCRHGDFLGPAAAMNGLHYSSRTYRARIGSASLGRETIANQRAQRPIKPRPALSL